ncbi:MAG: serine/threonine-protein kinase PknK [Deltaproteobacteria bacterium]|nr:serine/threonine-protein kinase PknK [Deltaproteobacteria bacterium]
MVVYANRYEEIKRLGHGVTGNVYLANDIKSGQKCAMKFLKRPHRGDRLSPLMSFKREFETLKGLNHPNIAKVLDSGYDKNFGEYYIVTEFVQGEDLFTATENGTIQDSEDLLVQTLRALNYLHSKKIYHLDLKPPNILVVRGSDNTLTIKIIDFGYANFFESADYKARAKEDPDNVNILGTPAYTSPEVIKGETPDGRSDIYSLGCVFYTVLTRGVPFTSEVDDPHEVHWKHLHKSPPPPIAINQNIPPYLNDIIITMMAKEADRRPLSCEAIIKEMNLFKTTPYEIETKETRMSYLPERGALIGREVDLKRFRDLYFKRIKLEDYSFTPFLIVTGGSGSGKSRFLSECINYVRGEFCTNILSWKEFNPTFRTLKRAISSEVVIVYQ